MGSGTWTPFMKCWTYQGEEDVRGMDMVESGTKRAKTEAWRGSFLCKPKPVLHWDTLQSHQSLTSAANSSLNLPLCNSIKPLSSFTPAESHSNSHTDILLGQFRATLKQHNNAAGPKSWAALTVWRPLCNHNRHVSLLFCLIQWHYWIYRTETLTFSALSSCDFL